jgi:hypothetical protein
MASGTKTKPDRYDVEGFVPRDRLTLYERKRLGGRGRGLWLPIKTVAEWSPRGAVKKVVERGELPDPRMTRFRARLAGAKAKRSRPRATGAQIGLPFDGES